jgi:ABC-type amino acid transport system permease subunit
MRLVVIPQTLPFMIPPLLNTFVGLLKVATLAAAVGAPEILYRAQVFMNKYGDIRTPSLVVIIIYVVATVPLLRATAALERRVRSRY